MGETSHPKPVLNGANVPLRVRVWRRPQHQDALPYETGPCRHRLGRALAVAYAGAAAPSLHAPSARALQEGFQLALTLLLERVPTSVCECYGGIEDKIAQSVHATHWKETELYSVSSRSLLNYGRAAPH